MAVLLVEGVVSCEVGGARVGVDSTDGESSRSVRELAFE